MAECQKHNTGPMTLAGKTYNMPVDLVNDIQSDINATAEATLAHATWLAKVAVMRQSHEELDPVLSLFKRRVVSEVGNTQDAQGILGDYGWTSQKQPKRKVADKLAAVQKGQGTRKLRNTMGSKEKLKVKAGPSDDGDRACDCGRTRSDERQRLRVDTVQQRQRYGTQLTPGSGTSNVWAIRLAPTRAAHSR